MDPTQRPYGSNSKTLNICYPPLVWTFVGMIYQSNPTELRTRILREDPPAAAALRGLDLDAEAVALDDND